MSETVKDGQICVEKDGVRIWFSETVTLRAVAKLEADLFVWKQRLKKLRKGQQ